MVFLEGEKKKNEILQMKILDPNLSILDETDSGLDIDALKIIAKGVNSSRSEKKILFSYNTLSTFAWIILNQILYMCLSDGKILKLGCRTT